jgi:hypothetical protein
VVLTLSLGYAIRSHLPAHSPPACLCLCLCLCLLLLAAAVHSQIVTTADRWLEHISPILPCPALPWTPCSAQLSPALRWPQLPSSSAYLSRSANPRLAQTIPPPRCFFLVDFAPSVWVIARRLNLSSTTLLVLYLLAAIHQRSHAYPLWPS